MIWFASALRLVATCSGATAAALTAFRLSPAAFVATATGGRPPH